jgi:voltage-gated potassium channel
LAEFEDRIRLPILVSAILPILLAYGGTDGVITDVVLVVTWIVFVVDFVVHRRLVPGYLSTRQGRFDLFVVVLTGPWFLIPGFGAARFVSLARLARLARVVKASGGGIRRLAQQLGRVGLVTVILIFAGAYVAYVAEHPVNDLYADFGDSLWWATVTITTVGYGDIYPITPMGRAAAIVLMFSGLGVLGILAGALASFFGFGQADPPEESTTDAAPSASTAALTARLEELDGAIAAVRAEIARRG